MDRFWFGRSGRNSGRSEQQRPSNSGNTTNNNAAAPPWQQYLRPTITSQLLRSWSNRTARLCLDHATSLESDVADRDPGYWRDAYMEGLKKLFEDQIACDVTFRLPGRTTGIGAHWCILEARNYQPFVTAPIIVKGEDGHDEVLLSGTFQEGDEENLRQAVASCYGIASQGNYQERRFGAVPVRAEDVVGDLVVLDKDSIPPTYYNGAANPTRVAVTSPRRHDALSSVLLQLFGQKTYWSVHDLAAQARARGIKVRSNREVRQVLLEIGIFHRSGEHKNMWELNKKLPDQKPPPKPNNGDKKEPRDEGGAFMAIRQVPPPDVMIVASPGASPETTVAWSVEAYKSLLCAHSEYFRSFLTHDGWSFETEAVAAVTCSDPDDKNPKHEQQKRIILRLDSTQFAEGTVRSLISSCYGRNPFGSSLESLLDLVHGATYFGMKAASLRYEEALAVKLSVENLGDMYRFAEDHGTQRLSLECHKFVCRSLTSIRATDGALAKLGKSHMEAMLRSNFVECLEDDILDIVMTWADQTEATFDDTKELLRLVRLPFVPVDSSLMAKAMERNLVGEDMIRVCRLFQTDGDYRATMMNNEPMYHPRITRLMKLELEQQLRPPPPPVELNYPDFGGAFVCRMLGTVNGRENFEKIRSIQVKESGDQVTCVFPDSKTVPVDLDFPFGSIVTGNMANVDTRYEQKVDRNHLEALELKEVEDLLAALLKRENSLRLHPRVQSALGSIGEDEKEMSRFTMALQAHVATEFNVDPVVGIELIRSATTLFPETAKLAHYVRHNRCFQGDLRVGNDAPDVNLLTLAGKPTSLWTEIDKRRCGKLGIKGETKPVVILGASYT